MKKKIKIIILLNKIANGEKVPKKIIYGLNKWIYDEEAKDYFKPEDAVSFQTTYVSNPNWLNFEVEILDEEDEFEDIKEIPIPETESKDNLRIVNAEIKIDQLIRNQKKIIERLNNERD